MVAPHHNWVIPPGVHLRRKVRLRSDTAGDFPKNLMCHQVLILGKQLCSNKITIPSDDKVVMPRGDMDLFPLHMEVKQLQ